MEAGELFSCRMAGPRTSGRAALRWRQSVAVLATPGFDDDTALHAPESVGRRERDSATGAAATAACVETFWRRGDRESL